MAYSFVGLVGASVGRRALDRVGRLHPDERLTSRRQAVGVDDGGEEAVARVGGQAGGRGDGERGAGRVRWQDQDGRAGGFRLYP